ncbi:UNVERIFIED_CONTAM: hypothetical protein Sindi_2834700, partial [Sesamum indicum]
KRPQSRTVAFIMKVLFEWICANAIREVVWSEQLIAHLVGKLLRSSCRNMHDLLFSSTV